MTREFPVLGSLQFNIQLRVDTLFIVWPVRMCRMLRECGQDMELQRKWRPKDHKESQGKDNFKLKDGYDFNWEYQTEGILIYEVSPFANNNGEMNKAG